VVAAIGTHVDITVWLVVCILLISVLPVLSITGPVAAETSTKVAPLVEARYACADALARSLDDSAASLAACARY